MGRNGNKYGKGGQGAQATKKNTPQKPAENMARVRQNGKNLSAAEINELADQQAKAKQAKAGPSAAGSEPVVEAEIVQDESASKSDDSTAQEPSAATSAPTDHDEQPPKKRTKKDKDTAADKDKKRKEQATFDVDGVQRTTSDFTSVATKLRLSGGQMGVFVKHDMINRPDLPLEHIVLVDADPNKSRGILEALASKAKTDYNVLARTMVKVLSNEGLVNLYQSMKPVADAYDKAEAVKKKAANNIIAKLHARVEASQGISPEELKQLLAGAKV